jgi:hypothetical protein
VSECTPPFLQHSADKTLFPTSSLEVSHRKRHMALPHRHGISDNSPRIQPPKWAEDVHSRAMRFLATQSPANSFNLSHADMAATLACVVRAVLFVENQQQQSCSPRESSQSADMSIVTPSSILSPQIYSARSSNASVVSAGAAFASLSPRSAESSSNVSAICSPAAAPPHLAALYIGIFDDEKTPSKHSPQSFTFSAPTSPLWSTSDEAALQSLHHHPAHYQSLLTILRNCWACKVFGRLCLPSEEAAVVASFVQHYPLPTTSAPDWEISEFSGNSCF